MKLIAATIAALLLGIAIGYAAATASWRQEAITRGLGDDVTFVDERGRVSRGWVWFKKEGR